MKDYLFIIDPQYDFIEGGNLPVSGGKEALDNIVNSGILDRDWDGIFVTIDTHYQSNFCFENSKKTELMRDLYEDVKGIKKWPVHCLKDTHGWEIYKPLYDKLKEINVIKYFLKGEEDDKESYSAFLYGDGSFNESNIGKFLDFISSKEPIRIFYTGLAEDYCVLETIKSLVKFYKERSKYDPNYPEWEHVLISNMTSPIDSRELVDEKYSEISRYNFFKTKFSF